MKFNNIAIYDKISRLFGIRTEAGESLNISSIVSMVIPMGQGTQTSGSNVISAGGSGTVQLSPPSPFKSIAVTAINICGKALVTDGAPYISGVVNGATINLFRAFGLVGLDVNETIVFPAPIIIDADATGGTVTFPVNNSGSGAASIFYYTVYGYWI